MRSRLYFILLFLFILRGNAYCQDFIDAKKFYPDKNNKLPEGKITSLMPQIQFKEPDKLFIRFKIKNDNFGTHFLLMENVYRKNWDLSKWREFKNTLSDKIEVFKDLKLNESTSFNMTGFFNSGKELFTYSPCLTKTKYKHSYRAFDVLSLDEEYRVTNPLMFSKIYKDLEFVYYFIIAEKKQKKYLLNLSGKISFKLPEEIATKIQNYLNKSNNEEEPKEEEDPIETPPPVKKKIDFGTIQDKINEAIKPFKSGPYGEISRNYKTDEERWGKYLSYLSTYRKNKDKLARCKKYINETLQGNNRLNDYLSQIEPYFCIEKELQQKIDDCYKSRLCEEFNRKYQELQQDVERKKNNLSISKMENDYQAYDRLNCDNYSDDNWGKLNNDYNSWQLRTIKSIFNFNRMVDRNNATVKHLNDEYGKECSGMKPGFDKYISLVRDIEGLGREIAGHVIDADAMHTTVLQYTERVTLLTSKISTITGEFVDMENKTNDYSPYTGRYGDKFTKSVREQFIADLDSLAQMQIEINSDINIIHENAKNFYIENRSVNKPYNESIFEEKTGLGDLKKVLNQYNAEDIKLNMNKWQLQKPSDTKFFIWEITAAILLFGAIIYFRMLMIKMKMQRPDYVYKLAKRLARKLVSTPHARTTSISAESMDGIEVVEEESVLEKGKGLEHIKQLQGGQYYEIDLKRHWEDTAVRKVYFQKDCIIKTYRYFEDLQLSLRNHEEIDEHGGFLIGRWDFNPFNDSQYDLSIEDFIEPGRDAKFTKYNIEFGNEIAQNLERKLSDYASKGMECVMTAWIHSHPGHTVFLSKFDLNVQDQLRDPGHEKRTIALVIDTRTEKCELGVFSFNPNNEMNNIESMKQMFYFDDLYNWALNNSSNNLPDQCFQKSFPFSSGLLANTIYFSNNFILILKQYIGDYILERTGGNYRVIMGQKMTMGTNKFNYFYDSVSEEYDRNSEDNSTIPVGLVFLNVNNLPEESIRKSIAKSPLNEEIDTLLIYNFNQENFAIYATKSSFPLLQSLNEPVILTMKDIKTFKNR